MVISTHCKGRAAAVILTRLLSVIWKGEKFLPWLQTALYSLCLAALVLDAFHTGNVADALILEAICLAVFLWAHIGKCTRWIRISGIIIITVALYMTKDFWLSLSWWIYLLAAGGAFKLPINLSFIVPSDKAGGDIAHQTFFISVALIISHKMHSSAQNRLISPHGHGVYKGSLVGRQALHIIIDPVPAVNTPYINLIL